MTIAYFPWTGVTMRVNGALVTRLPDHEVIDALLRAWAAPDPVSGRLRRLALEHPC